MNGGAHDGNEEWIKRRRTWKLALIVLSLVLIMFIIARSIPTRGPDGMWVERGDSWLILHIFEFACLFLMLISFLHALLVWGRTRAVMFFTFGLIYGFILEDITVTFSGYYEYNPNAWMVIHNTMMAVPFCWTAVMYVCARTIERNHVLNGLARIEKGLLAGVLAVSIDVAIDSVFVDYGLWYWTEGHWFGVPLANYTAWFMAVGGFVVFWSDVDGSKVAQSSKELGLAAGVVMSYASLLLMVFLTYLASEVWFP